MSDACGFAIGSVLLQKGRPVAYFACFPCPWPVLHWPLLAVYQMHHTAHRVGLRCLGGALLITPGLERDRILHFTRSDGV